MKDEITAAMSQKRRRRKEEKRVIDEERMEQVFWISIAMKLPDLKLASETMLIGSWAN